MCYGCNKRGHFKTMCHSSEVQAHDQNTGKTKNVNIVEMIRSMGLSAKNSATVQEMSIVHDISKNENPVFYTPVHAQIVMTIWENCQEIMEPEVCSYTS